jgi:hypothetical protein
LTLIMKKNTGRPSANRSLRRTSLVALALWTPVCTAGEGADEVPATEAPSVVARPLPEGVPSLQMSTSYAHPALGFGTYMPMGQTEARAIRVEPFTVRAAVQTGIGYDDNVALSSTNKVGSMFATVAPSVAVGLERPNHRFYAVYRGQYGTYASKAQDDYADHDLGLSAANSWATRFRTLLEYDYTKGHTPRGITATAGSETQRWTQHVLRGTANYGAVGAQGGLQGELGHISRRYSGAAGSVVGDYDRAEAAGTFYYRVAPKTRALVQASWADIEHPRDATLDNTESRYDVGVVWEALATTTGRARVGYITKSFSSAVRNDFTGLNYEGAVTWTPRPQSSVDVRASRSLSESYEIGSTFVVNTLGTVAWNHQWPRRIRSTATYTYGRVAQQGLNRTDNYQNWGARVSYSLRRSLLVGAELRRDSRESDLTVLDYTRNIMLLTLEAAL